MIEFLINHAPVIGGFITLASTIIWFYSKHLSEPLNDVKNCLIRLEQKHDSHVESTKESRQATSQKIDTLMEDSAAMNQRLDSVESIVKQVINK